MGDGAVLAVAGAAGYISNNETGLNVNNANFFSPFAAVRIPARLFSSFVPACLRGSRRTPPFFQRIMHYVPV